MTFAPKAIPLTLYFVLVSSPLAEMHERFRAIIFTWAVYVSKIRLALHD